MVDAGEALGLAILALLNPVDGDQLYVVAPLAVKGVEVPAHIVTFADAVTEGIGLTVTAYVAVLLQLPVLPVTV